MPAIAFPALVAFGSQISSAYANQTRNAILGVYQHLYSWESDVSANGRNLAGVGTLSAVNADVSGLLTALTLNVTTVNVVGLNSTSVTATTVTSSGRIKSTGGDLYVEGVTPQITWKEIDATSDKKLWKVYAADGNLHHATVNDADTAAVDYMVATRTGNQALECSYTTSLGISVRTPTTSDRQVLFSNDNAGFYYYLGRRALDGVCVLSGNQPTFSGFVFANVGIERFSITPANFYLQPGILLGYASNAAAIAGGRQIGQFYYVSGSNPRQIAQVF